jgi:hypothetical protein
MEMDMSRTIKRLSCIAAIAAYQHGVQEGQR